MFKPLPKKQDPITIIAGVAMAGSAIGGAKAASKQAKAQNEANQAQQRAASASAQRERIKAIRGARMAAGMVSNTGAGMGMGQTSSGIAGSLSSIGSQAGSNIANINVQEGFAEMASQANQRAANAAAKGAQWQAIGQIGSMAMSWGMKGVGNPGANYGNVANNSIAAATKVPSIWGTNK